MPAPSTAYLYDLESPYEDALADYFDSLDIFAQILTPRTSKENAEHLITPRVQIRAGHIAMPPTGSSLQESEEYGERYLSYWGLGITVDVVTARSNVNQSHGLLRGAARVAFLKRTAVFNNNSVPYFQTVLITPQSSTQVIDPANDEIQTQLVYAVEVWIPPSSFPNVP